MLVTAANSALNPALVEPAETVAVAGIVTAGLLLLSDTTTLFNAGEVKYTEHPLTCGPVNDCVPQETMLSDGEDAPLVWEEGEAAVPLFMTRPPQPHTAMLMQPTSIMKRSLAESNLRKIA
jgi:hypothetical protein